MRDALVDQRRGNPHLEFWRIAGAETLDHRVVGCQRLLGLAALAVRDALVDQRRGNLHLEFWRIAGAETLDHRVVGCQRLLGLAALAVRDALVDQRSAVATCTWSSGASLAPKRSTTAS